jgi:hypothetical protein
MIRRLPVAHVAPDRTQRMQSKDRDNKHNQNQCEHRPDQYEMLGISRNKLRRDVGDDRDYCVDQPIEHRHFPRENRRTAPKVFEVMKQSRFTTCQLRPTIARCDLYKRVIADRRAFSRHSSAVQRGLNGPWPPNVVRDEWRCIGLSCHGACKYQLQLPKTVQAEFTPVFVTQLIKTINGPGRRILPNGADLAL